ncbi:MAG: TIGR04282 family arsenosugar biosynthesis glycosyltransferase [Myxococcota bacterium]
MSRGWLIVFGKVPQPGRVKTRLSPPLSLIQSADLYAEMLADVLEASLGFAADLGLEPVLAFDPPEGLADILPLVPAGFRLQAQRGTGLGERMANAFAEAFGSGAERVLLRGSDSPAIGSKTFEDAMRFLDEGADIALSPDQGGGYAVVGMRSPHPELFNLPMSTERVLDQTIQFSAAKKLRLEQTGSVFDLDVATDFQELAAVEEEIQLDLCPRTVKAISLLNSDGVL